MSAATAWVGARALMAKSELELAVPLASQVQHQISEGNVNGLRGATGELLAHARKASELSSDPVWRAFELIPVLGSNLTASRKMAEAVEDVSVQVIGPLTNLTRTMNVSAFKPVNGTIDLQPLVAARPELSAAHKALVRIGKAARAIDTSATVGPVTAAARRLNGSLDDAEERIGSVDRAVQLVPAMLGSSGPRTYLLLFQNNAEVRATGGLPGAFAQINTSGGHIELARQSTASGIVFPKPVLDLPIETRGIYSDRVSTYLGDATLTPHFPTSARVVREMWARTYGTEVDGIISMDPVSLGYLLRATGPVTLATGDVLTSKNAVNMLLRDVYARYDKPAAQDAFFAAAAAAVFQTLTNGQANPKALIEALAQAGDERRILLWSAHQADQKVLEGTTLVGDLPTSDTSEVRFGVYLNDGTGAKMDTYLDLQIALGEVVCRKDRRPYYAVDVTLKNKAPADAATSLPESVTGGGRNSVSPGNIKTLVLVYGPNGAQHLGVTRDGEEISYHPATDTGRAVSQTAVELAPGESSTVRAYYLGGSGHHGALVAEKTPVINLRNTEKMDISCESPLW